VALPLGKEADVKKPVRFAAFLILLLQAPVSFAQFKPGNVFVSDPSPKYCFRGDQYGWDRIWEVNPDTGEYRVFAELRDADCGFVTGLAFSPDGCRLRASVLIGSKIVEFLPDGSGTVVLDGEDGIRAPWGASNLAYDAQAHFYVSDSTGRVLRFPADGSAGEVFAIPGDGIGGTSAIAFTSDGDLYFADHPRFSYIVHVTPKGEVLPFIDYGTGSFAWSLVADLHGHLFASVVEEGVHSFTAGDPGSDRVLAPDPAIDAPALAMADDNNYIYAASYLHKDLRAIDPNDGTPGPALIISEAGQLGWGIAVVPATAGDVDRNGRINLTDWSAYGLCLLGPAIQPLSAICRRTDLDHDGDSDLLDVGAFQNAFGQTRPECP